MPKSAQLLVISAWLLLTQFSLQAADAKPEEVVARHLESIGSAEARAAIKNRVVQGNARFRLSAGGTGELGGIGGFVSEQNKFNFTLKFNGNYRGEEITSDGAKAYIAPTLINHKRSNFGEFLQAQDFLVK